MDMADLAKKILRWKGLVWYWELFYQSGFVDEYLSEFKRQGLYTKTVQRLADSFLHILPEKRKLISDDAEEDWIQKWISMHKKDEKPTPDFVKVQREIKNLNRKYLNSLK